MHRLLSPILGLVLTATIAHADNWPAWRGPSGQGYCEEKNIPTKWSANENVKWKVALRIPWQLHTDRLGRPDLPDPGQQGPKSEEGREGEDRPQGKQGPNHPQSAMPVAKDGSKLWQKDVHYDIPERNWSGTLDCNASPVTDGERVVACFGSAGLYCYDFSGKELWKRVDLGQWEHQFGNGDIAVIFQDLVIQWCGPNEGKGRSLLPHRGEQEHRQDGVGTRRVVRFMGDAAHREGGWEGPTSPRPVPRREEPTGVALRPPQRLQSEDWRGTLGMPGAQQLHLHICPLREGCRGGDVRLWRLRDRGEARRIGRHLPGSALVPQVARERRPSARE